MRLHKIKFIVSAVCPEQVFVPGKTYAVNRKMAKQQVESGAAVYSKEHIINDPIAKVHIAAIIKPKIEIVPKAEKGV